MVSGWKPRLLLSLLRRFMDKTKTQESDLPRVHSIDSGTSRPAAVALLGRTGSFSQLQFLWGHDLDLFAFSSVALARHVMPGGYSLHILLCELLNSLPVHTCSWTLAFPGCLGIFRLAVRCLKAGGVKGHFLTRNLLGHLLGAFLNS